MSPELEPQETEQNAPQDASSQNGSFKTWISANRWLALFAGIVVMGVVALCLIAMLMLLSFREGRDRKSVV